MDEIRDISCNVYHDLIPLVRDNVASDESNTLVYRHIENCESCRKEFESLSSPPAFVVNDRKIINSIKKSIMLTSLLFLACGAMFGVYLSNSLGMFYNFLIMPVVGCFGYLVLKKRWYIAPAGVFILTFIYLLVKSILEGAAASGLKPDLFQMPFNFGFIYCLLSLLGAAIAALLKFAFGKEVIK